MISKNNILERKENKHILYDLFYKEEKDNMPVVIFCHGYKGFKDWGAWDLMAKAFMNAGFFFLKFNFSHNGGTMENPIDFPDLDAFAENNYTKELDDVQSIIDHITSKNTSYSDLIDIDNICLIGHSRGGGIAILSAYEDSRIKQLITYASVADYGKRSSTSGDLENWKRDGVKYIMNGRTKQMMPHNYQFYLNFKENEKRLHIETAERNLKIPQLIIHSKNDPSVHFNEAKSLHEWNPSSDLLAINDSNHVFGASHPWDKEEMPVALEIVVNESMRFIMKNIS